MVGRALRPSYCKLMLVNAKQVLREQIMPALKWNILLGIAITHLF